MCRVEHDVDQTQAHRQWVQSAVDRYQRPLWRYAASLRGDHDRAADAVQETFCRLCRQREDAIGDHLAAWLFAVCRRCVIDSLRKSKRMGTMQTITLDLPDASDPPGEAAHHELQQHVRHAVTQLPTRQRELVELKFEHGFSYRQIADITGLTVTNVGYLLHTAVTTLRRELHA
jgi:RNA polymerase sigma-70 factor (ECF subfamily)